jgi:predicted Zn-dependent peptidase
MVYKAYEYDSFRIFTIQTDQFKNAHMEVVFQGDAKTSKLTEKSFLSEIMCFSSKQFPTRKEFVIRMEELYNAYLYGVTSKVGNTLLTNFVFDFLDPYYVLEEHYLEDCMAFLFDTIMHPNIKQKAFDYHSFQIIKSRFRSDIESLKENAVNYSLRQSLKIMYPDSISSQSVLGTIEELESITPESLVNAYQNLFETSYCDIYIIGNLDMDKMVKLILKHFKNHVIKTHEQITFVKNKKIKEVKKKIENGKFVQSNLVMGYQMQGFTEKEYHSVLAVFGEIFCGSSLNSKLYQYLRNDNSLCYRVQTIYQKFDETLLISVGLESKNKNLAVKLIQKAMSEMAMGKFSDEEMQMAKEQLVFALTMSLDNQNSIINNYLFHNLVGTPLLEARKKEFMEVTKEDIIRLAKKMKPALIYELKEVSHEGN